jgi:prolyl-tRNA synthetase
MNAFCISKNGGFTMRQQSLLLPTLREVPSEAEALSHQLLLRAGFIRQVAAGIYTYLPLGRRVLRNLERIVREEMDLAGAQEVLMPAMQPAELWQQSGRYAQYGPELVRFTDRHAREFVLGPTHEEVITALVGGELSSYRKLPVALYQIQTKFRDERRPRFGLLRCREFLMKDAYSFHADWDSLGQTYEAMVGAYRAIFGRCELTFRAVEADGGTIGGEGGTHEFMALASVGEDTIVTCRSCDYAANLEKAEAAMVGSVVAGSTVVVAESTASTEEAVAGSTTNMVESTASVAGAACEPIHTPQTRTIEELVQLLGVEKKQLVKTLIYKVDGARLIAVLVRGDHEANEVKLANFLKAGQLELADAETTQQVTGAPVGFAGPIGLSVPLLVDREVAVLASVIVGANKQDVHLRNVRPGEHFSVEMQGDFRNATQGDSCPRCASELNFHQGIEIGHVFKLGTKYSVALGASFTDAAGQEQPMIMGCYGIGVSRLLSAIVEQHGDVSGLVWPLSVAPFQVHLIPVNSKQPLQMELAENMYQRLQKEGIDVLLDDREERPGVKFKDADLIGIPLRIVIGKGAEQAMVEFKHRKDGEAAVISAEEAIEQIREFIAEARVEIVH